MFKANWMAVLIIGTLLSAEGLADDAKSSHRDGEPPQVPIAFVESLLVESAHASRWKLSDTAYAMTDVYNWSRPIGFFGFQDASNYVRIRKLRSMSLLTLAEIGHTRLFLGVNEEGVVGLHFSAMPHYGDERYLELARMSYLHENERDRVKDHTGSKPNQSVQAITSVKAGPAELTQVMSAFNENSGR